MQKKQIGQKAQQNNEVEGVSEGEKTTRKGKGEKREEKR